MSIAIAGGIIYGYLYLMMKLLSKKYGIGGIRLCYESKTNFIKFIEIRINNRYIYLVIGYIYERYLCSAGVLFVIVK